MRKAVPRVFVMVAELSGPRLGHNLGTLKVPPNSKLAFTASSLLLGDLLFPCLSRSCQL
jgi:hypothetical protein